MLHAILLIYVMSGICFGANMCAFFITRTKSDAINTVISAAFFIVSAIIFLFLYE